LPDCFETQVATATAWRWLAALFLIGGSLVLWYRNHQSKDVRTVLIALTVAPLLVLTFYPALRTIYYLPVQGPISGIFSWFDDDFSYGTPLVLVALVMVGYALRERRPEFSVYGGLLLNATVTLAFLLAVVNAKGAMDRVVTVRLAQLNAITFAVYALPWLSTRRRWLVALDQDRARLADNLLNWQISLAIVLNVMLLAPVVVELIASPAGSLAAPVAAGNFLGWLALIATLVAIAWLRRLREQKLPVSFVAGALWGLACLTALSVADVSGWVALHTLTVAATVVTGMLVAGAFATTTPSGALQGWVEINDNWRSRCRQLAVVTGAIAFYLSLRTAGDSGMSRWWSVGPLLALTIFATALNWQSLRRRYLYIAGFLLTMATDALVDVYQQASHVPHQLLVDQHHRREPCGHSLGVARAARAAAA
jgi:hypothetical protein